MTIQVGEKLPEATFRIMTADGPAARTTAEIFAGKTVVLFAVPGAFTPTCHKNHMPGFIANAEALKAKGVDAIYATSTNDVFVLDAWQKASGAVDKVGVLADGSADFAKAIGLANDMSAFGMGMRSKRYSMVVKDGVVASLNIEDAPGKADVSGAENLLKQLAELSIPA
jgi:peroxiredoxin